ncbi:MAG: hypothetical protein CVV41_18125 [Candidatus Riflebacteria bacterium HGW-Riflebacteria-1]|jgi:hypothetical protein|nr:MAG: hypothetical protein CVV41_18125 [Candidatus Riflebacteria bacterium HGW-Riflebacteria-1]
MPTQPHFVDINMGPEIPLGRRGCRILSSKSPNVPNGWDDTFFSSFVRTPKEAYQAQKILKDFGELCFSLLKKLRYSDESIYEENLDSTLLPVLAELMKIGVVSKNGKTNELKLKARQCELGPLFECAVSMALLERYIHSKREVQIEYPYSDKRKDSDGQPYDVIGALDVSNIVWIEAKKPLYLERTEQPLANVLSKEKIKRFFSRAMWLKPKIAIFLVDTDSDYFELLEKAFVPKFTIDNHLQKCDPIANHIVARIYGFMYFLRVKKKSQNGHFHALVESISQALHDNRFDNVFVTPGYDEFEISP